METTVGTFEAKTHFAELIERAVQGQETLITRRGKLVAKIVPIGLDYNTENAEKIVHRLRNLAQQMQWSPQEQEWKNYRDEGRS